MDVPEQGVPGPGASSGTSGGMCVHSTSTSPTASIFAAYSSSLISYGVRIGVLSPPPTNPNTRPPISTRSPSRTVVPGPAYSAHRGGMSTLP